MKKMFKKLLALFLVLLAPCAVTHGYGGEEIAETGDDSDIHPMVWRVALVDVDGEGFVYNERRIKRLAEILIQTGIELQAVHFPSAVDMIHAIRSGECDCGFWGYVDWPEDEPVDGLCWVAGGHVWRIGCGFDAMPRGALLAHAGKDRLAGIGTGLASLLEAYECNTPGGGIPDPELD